VKSLAAGLNTERGLYKSAFHVKSAAIFYPSAGSAARMLSRFAGV